MNPFWFCSFQYPYCLTHSIFSEYFLNQRIDHIQQKDMMMLSSHDHKSKKKKNWKNIPQINKDLGLVSRGRGSNREERRENRWEMACSIPPTQKLLLSTIAEFTIWILLHQSHSTQTRARNSKAHRRLWLFKNMCEMNPM